MICALFPGQGFQRFGMLAPLAKQAPRVVDQILRDGDAALPQLKLSDRLLGLGPETDVTPTELAQPLLLAQGYAHYRQWEHQNAAAKCRFGMGHSLGEFTALTAANVLEFGEALQLVRARGEAMRKATENVTEKLGMTLVVRPKAFTGDWGARVAQVSADVDVAAYNSPSQVVVSGSVANLRSLADQLQSELGIKRLVTRDLPVSSAFHSRYMAPAATELAYLLKHAAIRFENRKFDVVSNVTGQPYTSETEIRERLVEALTSPVKWVQSYAAVESEVTEFAAMGGEIGKLMAKDTQVPTNTY